jgi:hypothetical protein
MPLTANTTNQADAVMLRQPYTNLPQEFVLYNALSGSGTNSYAHYERATVGWATMSATSAFSIGVTSTGAGIARDLYLQASQTNRIVLSAGSIIMSGVLSADGNISIASNLSAKNITVSNGITANNITVSNGIIGGGNLNIIPSSTTTYNFQLSDNGATIASANSTTGLSATPSASISYPTGYQVGVLQLSTGPLQVYVAGSPVIHQSNNYYKLTQYAAGTLIYTGASTGWVAIGSFGP